jgi:hypothetical protein
MNKPIATRAYSLNNALIDNLHSIFSPRIIQNKLYFYSNLKNDTLKLLDCLTTMKNTRNDYEFAVLAQQAQMLEAELLKLFSRLLKIYSDDPKYLEEV